MEPWKHTDIQAQMVVKIRIYKNFKQIYETHKHKPSFNKAQATAFDFCLSSIRHSALLTCTLRGTMARQHNHVNIQTEQSEFRIQSIVMTDSETNVQIFASYWSTLFCAAYPQSVSVFQKKYLFKNFEEIKLGRNAQIRCQLSKRYLCTNFTPFEKLRKNTSALMNKALGFFCTHT